MKAPNAPSWGLVRVYLPTLNWYWGSLISERHLVFLILTPSESLPLGGSSTHNPKCSLRHLRVVSNLKYGYPKIPYWITRRISFSPSQVVRKSRGRYLVAHPWLILGFLLFRLTFSQTNFDSLKTSQSFARIISTMTSADFSVISTTSEISLPIR